MTTSMAKTWHDKEYWLRLSLLDGVGPVSIRKLVNYFGSAEAVFAASKTQLTRVIPDSLCQKILNHKHNIKLNDKLAQVQTWYAASSKHHIVTQHCASYPQALKQLHDAPALLYVIGNPSLLRAPQIAIVGSRKASNDGLRGCKIFAKHLANYGLCITSGMALGIDTSAHVSSLEVYGSTIAVLGCGVDVIYPKRNKNLYNAIAEKGALVSEFPLGTIPVAGNFPRRNRLVVGLSLGVLVIEAAVASGSLISANLAAEQGKEVFAVPGSVFNPLTRGCHQLIRDGAILAESPDDILLELAPQLDACINDDILQVKKLDPLQEKIITCIGHEIASIDEINMNLNIDTGDLAAILTEMEIEGIIESTSGGFITSRQI